MGSTFLVASLLVVGNLDFAKGANTKGFSQNIWSNFNLDKFYFQGFIDL